MHTRSSFLFSSQAPCSRPFWSPGGRITSLTVVRSLDVSLAAPVVQMVAAEDVDSVFQSRSIAPASSRIALAVALVLLGVTGADAGDILRGGTPLGARPGGGKGTAGPVNAAAEAARMNAKDALARTTQAIASVKAMQEAARVAALKAPNNLGANPNFGGQTLPNVADGLTSGGLKVAAGVPKVLGAPKAGENAALWRGAALPTQNKKDGRVNVTVFQTKPQAVLNWETFNVGKKTTLTFNQDKGGADKTQWIAFNKVADPSGAPSQILGKIEAPGQVYVINPNGIMFGGSSQINLHALVASSLPINEGLISRGLLSNPDSQFLFSALPQAAGKVSSAHTPVASLAPGGKYGDVVVQNGAQISAPSSSNVGGRVMLVGPNVKNEGTISTPDGQTVLAAGLQVGITAHPSSDARLRGLDVWIGAVSVPKPAKEGDPAVIPAQNPAGTATNSGLIEAARGNATIAGKTVNQLGIIDSSTSVSVNGSISLLANFGATIFTPTKGDAYFSHSNTGSVTIGDNSIQQVLPELFNDKKVIGLELALRSRVSIQGRNILMGKESTLLAPNADVTLGAGQWLTVGESRQFFSSTGQIYLDTGAMINVAGTADVVAPISQNILSLELRGAELADSPLQRRGPLRGPTLNLDIRQRGSYNGLDWVGTPLGNAAGYVGLIERTVGELTTAGGTVTMNAGHSVVMQTGSKVDVSGGYVNFEGGTIKTTRIMSDGRVVDIANAFPDRVHTSLYDGTSTFSHTKYGVQETFNHPLALSGEHFEPGYIEGKNAGTVSITAPAMVLDGELVGKTISGPRQRTTALAPKLGALTLAFERPDAKILNYRSFSPTPPAITFGSEALPKAGDFNVDAAGNAAALDATRLAKVVLSPDLFTNFGSVTINNGDGSIEVPEEVKLKLQPRGSLTITAADFDIRGDITAPGGSLNFTALKITPYLEHLLNDGQRAFLISDFDATRGRFALERGVRLDVSGLVVDDRPLARDPLTSTLATDGGSISIAGFTVDLSEGSVIDASGGVVFDRNGRRTYGAGGSITIRGGNDPIQSRFLNGYVISEKVTDPDPSDEVIPPDKRFVVTGAGLNLGAQLRAFSGARGGSLTVQAPSIQIGGGKPESETTVKFAPEFFSEGGFASFSLTGLGEPLKGGEFVPGVLVAEGTQIRPIVKSLLAVPYGPSREGAELIPIIQPQALRTPASITLRAPGIRDTGIVVTRGDIVIGKGAHIETDPRGSISVAGETVEMLGALVAPGGSISVAGSSNLGLAFGDLTNSLTSVHLGPEALLSTKGTVLYTPNPFGFRTGSVLAGGRISVSGNIVAEAGSVLDVSGATGILDLAPGIVEAGPDATYTSIVPVNSGVNAPLFTRTLVPTQIDSDAGEITLTGGQHLYSDATLLGNAGGRSALGGTLSVSSSLFLAPGRISNPTDVTLKVTQSGPTLPLGGSTVIGTAVSDAPGVGHFAANSFLRGGFDALTLKGTVEFVGPVNIEARRTLSIADSGVLFANDAVTLKAPYVTMGQAFKAPLSEGRVNVPYEDGNKEAFKLSPTNGSGSLTVIANLIDIGNLALRNIGRANFIADNGDIRGNGALNVAGDIYMRAAQIYTPTANTFTIAAADYKDGEATISGSVRIEGSGNRQIPLSAGGTLNIYASNIIQGGALRVPLGSINLGWNGDGDAPINPVTGEAFATAKNITLRPGSITSVSAISPIEGAPLLIPFGINVNGVTWIDPTGRDITAGGVIQKTVNISGVNVNSQAGSLIDIRGGGDLFSYRWVAGNGGSRDLLASTTSFAVIPGYSSHFAPYAPVSDALASTAGYVNNALGVGDCIHLEATSTLAEGNYALLPARYALLPGAHLVTLKSGTPFGKLSLPDGSTLVPGYRFNGLNTDRSLAPQHSWFEVLSPDAISARSEYAGYLGNEFLFSGAASVEATIPRLASDAGQLTLQAVNSMNLGGRVAAGSPKRSRGGIVDIASPVDIVITGAGAPKAAGKLSLDAGQLSSFGAESMLIGGIRKVNGDGTTNITVKTNNLTVDNTGTALRGPEIILVANRALTLAEGAQIEQRGTMRSSADRLILGTASTAGSGDGTLLRVTSDPNAQITRNGLGTSTTPKMVVGAGATISGANVTLDSTSGTTLDPLARINAGTVSLNSGQISIQLENPGTINTTGLVLGGTALASLEKSGSVSLLSYTTFDIYGTGEFNVAGKLALHAGAIRGFNNAGGTTTISAGSLSLDNRANAVAPAPGEMSGTLELRAGTFSIGKGNVAIQQFSDVVINAPGGVLATNTGGISTQGDLTIRTPVLTAARSATQSIKAGGALVLENVGTSKLRGGLGASLSLEGTSVSAASDIVLPSGLLTVRATTGDVSLNGRVNLNGTEQTFYDLVRYTSGGTARFFADNGNVNIGADSVISVSAPSGGGDAGSLLISAPKGAFSSAGQFVGRAGVGGKAGSFSLDAASLASFDALETTLVAGGFTSSQKFRIRSGDVTLSGNIRANNFGLSADAGSINVTGTIDASGQRGGNITLAAGGSVVLAGGSRLTAAAKDFDAAGKGGQISLETRGNAGGVIDIQTGSTIDLGVEANTATSAAEGNFTGTLHLRAPQNAASNDLAVATIGGTVNGASVIIVEGYKTFDLGAGGNITTTVQSNVLANGNAFIGVNGTAAAGYNAMLARVLGTNTALDSVLSIRAGAELFNSAGNITLGTATSATTSDWDLSTYRFGADAAPGVLTLRAAGNVVLFNTISDGFQNTAFNSALLTQSSTQPVNAQSWSYRITAGADLTSADVSSVKPLEAVNANSGSLLLGKNGGNGVFGASGPNLTTAAAIGNRYQAIRTGSGDITINSARDVQLLNQFAVIFTAGTQVADATIGGSFDVPILNAAGSGDLGATQQIPSYSAQYTLGGGNVRINAGADIAHYTRIGAGPLIADSTRQMPVNWLYRRGFIDPVTGEFGTARFGDVASTTWWVDFSNFFEGVGALGGGNVTLDAGRNVANVDAVAPTNARMTKGAPDAANLVELGGGDVTVRAGKDIDGGVYYVERGRGTLSAGGSIKTNETRSPSLTILRSPTTYLPEQTWLPTTLFVGKGSFDVSARGDLLLGPTANPFLLPGGFNNTYWYKTYFSTYGAESGINATSLSGDVTLRLAATDSTVDNAASVLSTWFKNQLLLKGSSTASFYQPWLRLNETSVEPFTGVAALMPGSLNTTAFAGDINIVGNLTLSPSAKGSLTLAASGSVNGLNPTGFKPVFDNDTNTTISKAAWGATRINLSDANPASIPGIAAPTAYQATVGTIQGQARVTGADILKSVDELFAETGSNRSTLQTKQALHSAGVLHNGDSEPVRIYAGDGDIQGVTLFSPKAAQIFAGRDIADVALYIQNTSEESVSIVAAGRDILPYNANTQTRVLATSDGNVVNSDSLPLAGDLQISGPGTLEVLAGRNIDLGTGKAPGDGTALGIVSIGNARNPFLPFDGADLVVGAGIGASGGLGASQLDFDAFVEDVFTNPRYADDIAARLGTGEDADTISGELRNLIALDLFYKSLRNAGRDRNDKTSPNFGNYDGGFDAIATLFPASKWKGDISLTARQIKTAQGGDVSIFTPGGKIIVGFDAGAGQSLDQGILTESGGNINIFADGSVTLGTSRIFTLRGGNEIIWSSNGDIAAGTASKTVASAPPTRVLIDPQSADLKTDLAGLSTGGGIGVLTTVEGIPPGDVDLIAPNGAIDAGDAGIRSAGNLNVAADVVLNAENIQVSGSSAGAPSGAAPTAPTIPAAPPPPQPTDNNKGPQAVTPEKEREKEKEKHTAVEPPSIIVVEVLGYGG